MIKNVARLFLYFLVVISLAALGGVGGILLAYGLSYLDGPQNVGGSITWSWALVTVPSGIFCGLFLGLPLVIILIYRWRKGAKDLSENQEDTTVEPGSS